MRKRSHSGFTLIEVLIALTILAIIAGIAYPSFTAYITTARRTDGTINLTRIHALQEKFFTQCGIYAAGFGAAQNCAPPGVLLGTGLTQDGYYNITIAPGLSGTTLTSFTLTATPVGSQATNDSLKCSTITLDNTSRKGATGSDSTFDAFGGHCWKK